MNRCRPVRTSYVHLRKTVPPASVPAFPHSSTTAALDCASGSSASTSSEQRVRSAACRNRNHVARGILAPCSGAVEPRSSTSAENPAACNSKSVARSAWSILVKSGCVRAFTAGTARHRTHSNCRNCTPHAAADSASSTSCASTHAQTRSSRVCCARKLSARLVLPDEDGPVISLIAPTGSPPSSNSSTAAIPVAAVSRIVCAWGVSAEGNLRSRELSIWIRSAEAEAMRLTPNFAFSSPRIAQNSPPCQSLFNGGNYDDSFQ